MNQKVMVIFIDMSAENDLPTNVIIMIEVWAINIQLDILIQNWTGKKPHLISSILYYTCTILFEVTVVLYKRMIFRLVPNVIYSEKIISLCPYRPALLTTSRIFTNTQCTLWKMGSSQVFWMVNGSSVLNKLHMEAVKVPPEGQTEETLGKFYSIFRKMMSNMTFR